MKRTRRNLSLRLAISAAAMAFALSACHDKNPDRPAPETPAQKAAALAQRKKDLLDSVSGVWKPLEGDGLLTVYASAGKAQMADGDDPLPVGLGDVDPDNQTVVIKINWATRDELRTLALHDPTEGSAPATLQVTDGNGNQTEYTFVRKVSNDDLNRISRLGASPVKATTDANAAPQAQLAAATNRGVVDMWLGGIDMNLRSCPGSTCAAVLIVPKDSKLSVDTSTMRYVTETSGNNTPWVRVTYEGAYCTADEQDSQTGCAPSHGTEAPVTGWMNYTRLMATPRPQQ
ncbi:hypothetical protein AWB76_02181 [Caballeronia temeraria]|uniref:Lipoprotein n=1 Tax=Caballeronia temeraria TaxID=1777137 RepID=A0A158ACT1_9BURK|nr:hypothetical protein [Caballeronia temeraria]SAK55515.1 hypothetical protein AWB76_02181 [Caballeronia temeraria]